MTPASSFEDLAVSPQRELGAYEALWAKEGMTFKRIADLFRNLPGAVPSAFVGEDEALEHGSRAMSEIARVGIRDFGVRVHGANEYPLKLRDAAHPLELLYFRGNWDITAVRSVAIVGTRNPSPEGIRRAAKLSKLFVNQGFCVVSGLAKGIDTAAHTAAIAAGGLTVGVLGTPITQSYPAENRDLQKTIAENFLIISQVPIVRYGRQSVHQNKLFFPERNITMSALTEATVIVEAGETSGTLVQARHALQQKRKLFILDSCFRVPNLKWPHTYAERGALRVSDFEEIAHHLNVNGRP